MGSSSAIAGGSGMLAPVAVTLIVILLGAAIYMWRMRMLKSRAAMVTIGVIVLVLAYLVVASRGGPY